MRIPGRVSVSKAARIVGVHYNTMYSYCHKALNGKPSVIKDVQQDAHNKYITVSLVEVKTIAINKKKQ
jgi:hypothetical protein